MENVKISIIVPVFNTEKYLSECINSLINQTLKNIEIILVDDGSTDNSPAICDEFALKDNRIKVFHKENGGQSSARNLGLKNSNGEYILFVDSDDTILDVACEKMYHVAKRLKADIVHGDTLNQKEQIEKDSNVRYMPCENIVVDCYDYLRLALKYNCYDIVPWLNLIKKDYIVKNDLYFTEGRFYEDQEYANRKVKIPLLFL
ncbi:MAG: glycosyltransferase [Clostridia bacterium]|nr:glycosyltransferase [Clostridia bacterium]